MNTIDNFLLTQEKLFSKNKSYSKYYFNLKKAYENGLCPYKPFSIYKFSILPSYNFYAKWYYGFMIPFGLKNDSIYYLITSCSELAFYNSQFHWLSEAYYYIESSINTKKAGAESIFNVCAFIFYKNVDFQLNINKN